MWEVGAGHLPPGLTLDRKRGLIRGTPSEAGGFAFTLQATDAGHAVASQRLELEIAAYALDAYGGLAGVPCPSGRKPHFYAERIGRDWRLCTPAGHVFWMSGVYHVDASDSGADDQGIVLSNLVAQKYAAGPARNASLNWALASVRRLKSWGFNTLAEYANAWTLPVAVHSDWGTEDNTIPQKMPFVAFAAPSLYSMSNSGGYAKGPVKDLIAGVKTSVYEGYRSQSVDFWDPNFAQWFRADLANDHWLHESIAGPHNEYLVEFTVDDTDNLQGFGAGPDFVTTDQGVIATGYGQVHLGWVILVTEPVQSAGHGVSYTDTTVYSKKELGVWLSARYHGDIAGLNAAWGARYTSFGSNGGWGHGTGLLDEDGTCPARTSHCWVPKDSFTLNGAAPQMKRDLDDFLKHHAEKYFSTIRNILREAAPGVLYGGPTVLGTWGAPPRREILEAASESVDILGLSTTPPMCSNCTDIPQRIDFCARYGGDKPWISWEGFQAPADSYLSKAARRTDRLKTQAQRGQLYQKRIQQLLENRDTGGTSHLVGFKWWELYDNRGEQGNWGLITRRDDPYDGEAAAVMPGADSWGYPTGCLPEFGCEKGSYGDFLGAVRKANLDALKILAGSPR